MFVKRFCFVLVIALLITNIFTVTSMAARTGEFETGFVEFEALTPDDFVEPIEIVLTHKAEQYELKYYLYKVNQYFSNEPVPIGDFNVSVNIVNEEEEYGFIYEDSLQVESLSLAVPFRIIVDYASLEGGVSENEVLVADDDEEEEFIEELENFFGSEDSESQGKEKTEDIDENEDVLVNEGVEEAPEEENSGGWLLSLLFSVLLIVGVGLFVLWLKNR